jgi:lysozyme
MKATDNCIQLIKRFEGLYLKAYVCQAGVLTIGYGHTRGVKPGDEINELQAEIYLREDLEEVEKQLHHLSLPVNQNQFDALCSLVFNVGITRFMQSKMLKRIRALDRDASDEFDDWNKAGGKVLPGLVARRRAEKELFDRA